VDILKQYFPGIDENKQSQFKQLESLYLHWNAQINLISRKDIEEIAIHHFLHSLSLAKLVTFKKGTRIMDLGTGGGFPGIPLAIFFPEVDFVLLDSIGKKIMVVNEITLDLQLKNVQALKMRAEEWKGSAFDFVVSRAVAPIETLWTWAAPKINTKHQNALPNGLLALKGGNVKLECRSLPKGVHYEIIPVTDFFKHPWFEEKFIVYVQK
jgi:16S rRNA (guanine527-N7)-methyltransferase